MAKSRNSFFASIVRVFAAAVLACGALVEAHADPTDARPRLYVQGNAVVQHERITLGDIAVIRIKHDEHKELVAALKKVDLGEAPAPRLRISIPGQKVLSAIEASGVPLDAFGYSIPQLVEIERAGRVLSKEEVQSAVAASVKNKPSMDIQVREVVWSNAQVVPVGETTFEVQLMGTPSAGKLPLRIVASVDGSPAARFLATAVVDDWREVPVLTRHIERGMLISPDDIELVRLNMFKQPNDTAFKLKSVVGHRAVNNIAAGSVIRKSLIDIPPVIPKGKTIKMLYRFGGFHASATAIALDDGHEDDTIRVKNEHSRRVVRAKVINSEEVEVESE